MQSAQNTSETTLSISKTLFQTRVGWYRNERDGSGINLEQRNDSVFMDNWLLIPQSAKKFTMKAFLMSVEINDTKEMLYIISETDTIPIVFKHS